MRGGPPAAKIAARPFLLILDGTTGTPRNRAMVSHRRNELIEDAARRQFCTDHPGRDWTCVEAASVEIDRRVLYIFQAEEYLIIHGVIPPIV